MLPQFPNSMLGFCTGLDGSFTAFTATQSQHAHAWPNNESVAKSFFWRWCDVTGSQSMMRIAWVAASICGALATIWPRIARGRCKC